MHTQHTVHVVRPNQIPPATNCPIVTSALQGVCAHPLLDRVAITTEQLTQHTPTKHLTQTHSPKSSLSFWLTRSSTASSRRSCSLCADSHAAAV